MSRNIKPSRLLLTAISLLLSYDSCFALPDDTEQLLTIDASEVEFDSNQGTTTYSGTVLMTQGSMKIKAEKLVIHGKIDRMTKVVATGVPAHFQQTPEVKSKPVTAEAKRLEYSVDLQTLTLIGNAELDQEGTSLSGNKIEYDVKKAIVKAGSKKDNKDKTRVRMVIDPKALKPGNKNTPPEQNTTEE
jgi:lipopolysaccharide export system protein LptA